MRARGAWLILSAHLQAHLEGLAYTGTAAAEKIRSLDPDRIPERCSIAQMIRAGLACEAEPEKALARDFESWWTGRERGTRYAEIARDLRNDAAHDVYDKMLNGRRWTMRMDGRPPILLDEFAQQYRSSLTNSSSSSLGRRMWLHSRRDRGGHTLRI